MINVHKTKMAWGCRLLKNLIVLGVCIIFIVLHANLSQNEESVMKQYFSKTRNHPRINFDNAWMKNMSLTMHKRQQHLRENCERFGLNIRGNDSLHRPNPWEFLINVQHKLIWCNTFKAASTSWLYNFNVIAGYSRENLKRGSQNLLLLARKHYPRPNLEYLEKALNTSLSFLIVRHPFERLLSGYRDKIKHPVPNSYYDKLGTRIATKMTGRKKVPHSGVKPARPTFPEFVTYLFDLYKNGITFDEHWATITEFCSPCQVRFDIIMKFETLEDDQNYLINIKNLQNWIKLQWRNPSKDKTDTDNVIEKYYSQLTKFQIQQLYSIYKYDFQLFGYSADNYLKYGIAQ